MARGSADDSTLDADAYRVRELSWDAGCARPAKHAPLATELRPMSCVVGRARPAYAGARWRLAVTDGGRYTDVEKETMAHIRETYKFTEEADAWFREEIRRFAAR